MSDLDVAASDAANEQPDIAVEAPVTPAADETPEPREYAKSSTEALDRAFETIGAEPEKPKVERNRAPDGKFAPGKAEAKPVVATGPDGQRPAEIAVAPVSVPQFGLSKEAQAVWAQAPEALRKDVERRFNELTQGIEKHREAAQAYESVKDFDQMAKQGGTTLRDALSGYVNAENLLRNPQTSVQGMVQLCQRIGVDPVAMAQAMAQATQGQQFQAPQQQQRQLTPEEARALAREEARLALTEDRTVAQIEKFKADNPRFDELSGSIAKLLEAGIATNLPDAYAKAALLTPAQADALAAGTTPAAPHTPAQPTAVQPAQPNPQVAAKAKLSVTGSPSSASDAATRKIPGSSGDAINNAFARLGL